MKPNRRGSLLILVLWSLSLLCVFAVSTGFGVRQKMTLLRRLEALDDLESVAFSGAEKAKAAVQSDLDKDFDALTDGWANDERSFRNFEMTGGNFSVSHTEGKKTFWGAADEARKINLNTADAATITRLLEITAQLDHDEAEELAYGIVDWRDQDSNFGHPTYGGEDSYYEDLEVPYQAKDARLEALEELYLIKGMDPLVFDRIKPFVTVWGSGSVNANTASPAVLQALGLSPLLVQKIVAWRSGPDGKEGTRDDFSFKNPQGIVSELDGATPPPDGSERLALAALVDAGKLAVVSDFFKATSRGSDRSGASVKAELVFNRKGRTFYSYCSEVQWPSRN